MRNYLESGGGLSEGGPEVVGLDAAAGIPCGDSIGEPQVEQQHF